MGQLRPYINRRESTIVRWIYQNIPNTWGVIKGCSCNIFLSSYIIYFLRKKVYMLVVCTFAGSRVMWIIIIISFLAVSNITNKIFFKVLTTHVITTQTNQILVDSIFFLHMHGIMLIIWWSSLLEQSYNLIEKKFHKIKGKSQK